MADIDHSSILTLVFFFLSTIFVIRSLSFHVPLPVIGRTKITMGLTTAPILAIIILWAAQCIGTKQIRDGIVGTDGVKPYNILILFISLAYMSITLDITGILQAAVFWVSSQGGNNIRKLCSCACTLATPTPSLIISDSILGYGSHGTVIYRGSFQGRPVAIKRLLQDFATLATREISILQQSDDHPNVIRYYYQESHLNFFYIALELCPASLADIIEGLNENPDGERKEEWREIVKWFDVARAMRQIANGLGHLHELGLIHRDIKPQNILISPSSSYGGRGYRMLISDFGLCKKLDVDQTSFLPTGNGAGGTVGWRAPEILCGQVKLDEPLTGDDSTSSRGSITTVKGASPNGNGSTSTKTRLTKSVDIFALGCLFYYILTNGDHPYGDRFEREANIIKDNKKLSLLPAFCSTEESTEAADLITGMLHSQPCQRLDINACLLHPFFWNPAKRLRFLQDASDRFDVMCRDPMDAALIRLERDGWIIVGHDWYQMLDTIFVENLGKYRKYDGRSVRDLMRALRNKRHHYQSLPDDVKQLLGPTPEIFLGYFTDRYPRLFMHAYEAVKDTGLHNEPMFRTYFELTDS